MKDRRFLSGFKTVQIYHTLDQAQLRQGCTYAFITQFTPENHRPFDIVFQSVDHSFFAGGHTLDARDCVLHKIEYGNIFNKEVTTLNLPKEELQEILIQIVLYEYFFVVLSSLKVDYRGYEISRYELAQILLSDIKTVKVEFAENLTEYLYYFFKEELKIFLSKEDINRKLTKLIDNFFIEEEISNYTLPAVFPIQVKENVMLTQENSILRVSYLKVEDKNYLWISGATDATYALYHIPEFVFKQPRGFVELYCTLALSNFLLKYNYRKDQYKYLKNQIVNLDLLFDKISNVSSSCIDCLSKDCQNVVMDSLQICVYKENPKELELPISNFLTSIFLYSYHKYKDQL